MQSSSGQTFKVYKLRGKVIAIDPAKGEITVNHEAIAGFMEAMTMPYKLKEAEKSRELQAGDLITADVLVPGNDADDVLLDRIVVVAQARPHSSTQQPVGNAARN
jgi:protein SCO1/2